MSFIPMSRLCSVRLVLQLTVKWLRADCLLQSLIQDKSFRKYVELYAEDQDKYFEDFAAAYQKLLHLGVPVNNPGQHAPA